MKLNRVSSFAIVALTLAVIIGQGLVGVKAAPSAPANASISAHITQAASSIKGDKPAAKGNTSQPDTQEPINVTVQGRLTDASGNPITSPTAATFNLYNTPTGGTALLTHSATISPDANGLFTYDFLVPTSDSVGNYNNIQYFQGTMYLGITIATDAEMTPRFQLNASPYALSIAPGALISGNFDYSQNSANAVLNVYNTNTSNSRSRAIEGRGPLGLYGNGSWNSDSGVGVVGISYDTHGTGGAFTSTTGVVGYGISNPSAGASGVTGVGDGSLYSEGVSAYSIGTTSDFYVKGASARGIGTNADGIYASAAGATSVGAYGTAANSSSSNIGVYAEDYNFGNNAVGLQVKGIGQATGGFVTGGSYSMIVRYDGTEALHAGDVLALDGNNSALDNATIFGTVKAKDANAAIGVAQHRYTIFDVPAMPAHGIQPGAPARHQPQIDEQATSFQPGDYIEVVVIGQAQMKVSGSVNIGDHLGLDGLGNVVATKASGDSIAHVASTPDKDGNVLVFVNFK